MDFGKLSRGEFEEFCHLLMSKSYPGLKKVEGSGGDSGIDSYVGEVDKPTIILQYKHFASGRLSQSNRKTKILKDIEKARKFKPKEWLLLTSLSLSKKDYEWFHKNLINKYPEISIKILENYQLQFQALQPEHRKYLENKFPVLYEFQKILNDIKKDNSIRNLEEKGFLIYEQSDMNFGKRNDEKSCWETSNFNMRDIFDNHDVRRKAIDTIIHAIKGRKNNGILLLGNSASGKTTILKRIVMELGNEEFIVMYAEKPIDIHASLLKSAFSILMNHYEKPIMIVVDNFHNSNTIEYIKFFNEYDFPKIYFLFVANIQNFINYQKSLAREDRNSVDRAKTRLKTIHLKLTEADSKQFCSKVASIYNKTISSDRLDSVSKTIMKSSRNNLLILLCTLRELFTKEGRPQFDSKSYEKCLENDFGLYSKNLDESKLWNEGISCLLLSSIGIKITNDIIKLLDLSLLKINDLVSQGLLLEDENGSRRSKHESWATGFINYIIRDRFSNSIDSFIDQYCLSKIIFDLFVNLSKRELIIILERMGAIASDHFELGKRLIIDLDEKIYSKFDDREKSDIYCFGLARFYLALNETNMAIATFEKSLEFNPENFASLNNLGNVYERIGDYDKAIKCYQIAKTKNPNSGEPDYNISQIREMQGDLSSALTHINLSISTNDNYSPSYGVKGNILLKMRNLKEAELCYKRVLENDPNNNVSILGLGNLNFFKLLDRFPNLSHNVVFQFNLDDVVTVSHMLKYFQKYIDLYPYDKEGFYNMGKAQTLLGFMISSIENLDKALNFEKKNLPILLSQMNNYLFINDHHGAEHYIKLILEIDPYNIIALKNQSVIQSKKPMY